MDHLSRLRRNKKGAATPVQASLKADPSGKTTPPPGNAPVVAPSRPGPKLSPFRGFHLRSSHKRARDSSPASVTHSPTPAEPHHDPVAGRPTLSGDVSSTEKMGEPDAATEPPKPPKMPAFLLQTPQEIEFKYQELMWLERNRQLQSMQNPSPDFRWARTAEPYPKGLDRYMNIQPWGNNRIKLQVPEGYVNYINASPISVAPTAPRDETSPVTDTEPDRFIAMQGPKQATTDHVWRMIVEQLENPGVIVMLTETYESNQEKCFQYFPRRKEDPPLEINGHDEFGDGFLATVRCEEIEETPAGDAIQMRKLVVQILARASESTAGGTNGMSTKNGLAGIATPEPSAPDQGDLDVTMKSPVAAPAKGVTQADSDSGDLLAADTPPPEDGDPQRRNAAEVEELVVWHLLFKEWPDYGVPTLANLDNFFTLMRLSREKNTRPGNPRIVHCSAGVGRSGTFIALDHLIQELNAGAFEHYDEKMAATRSGTELDAAENGESEGDDSEGPSKSDEGDDPIYNTVNQLREQRRTMVQSDSQYQFIYQVMRKLWQDKYGRSEEIEVGEPAAKRLEVDPFVGGGHPH